MILKSVRQGFNHGLETNMVWTWPSSKKMQENLHNEEEYSGLYDAIGKYLNDHCHRWNIHYRKIMLKIYRLVMLYQLGCLRIFKENIYKYYLLLFNHYN